jgi:hypothetical protein
MQLINVPVQPCHRLHLLSTFCSGPSSDLATGSHLCTYAQSRGVLDLPINSPPAATIAAPSACQLRSFMVASVDSQNVTETRFPASVAAASDTLHAESSRFRVHKSHQFSREIVLPLHPGLPMQGLLLDLCR